MKKFFILALIMLLCLGLFAGCDDKDVSECIVSEPFEQVAVLYDKYGNMLEQTLYNKNTGEYIFKEYSYELKTTTWHCIDIKTTVLPDQAKYPYVDAAPRLSIYHNDDIAKKPIVLVDNDKVCVSIIKSLQEANWYKFAYELEVINKTDSVITIIIENAAIMNIGCPPLFNIDHIEANQKAYFTLGWDSETLERFYIPYIDNVEFMLKVYENDNWRAPAFAGEHILIKH